MKQIRDLQTATNMHRGQDFATTPRVPGRFSQEQGTIILVPTSLNTRIKK